MRGLSYFRSNDLEEGVVERLSVDLDGGRIVLAVSAPGVAGSTEIHTVTFNGVSDFERTGPSDRHRDSLNLDEADSGQLIYGIDDVGVGRRFHFSARLSSYGSMAFNYAEQVGGKVEAPPTSRAP